MKKGFTIVELIGVITVLALLIILVVPSLNSSASSARQKTYETKTKVLTTAAVTYGEDNYRLIVDRADANQSGYKTETIDGVLYRTHTVKVRDLIPDYIEEDNEGAPAGQKVNDPRANNKYLDDYTMTIKINSKTRKVSAVWNEP